MRVSVVLAVLCLVFVAGMVAGMVAVNKEDSQKKKTPFIDATIVVIDSCEYLRSDVYCGAVFTHKGNCKFCAERAKR